MTTSTNHGPQKAKSLSIYFASGGKLDKAASCLEGHGWAGWKRSNVFDPRVVNGLDVAGYGRSEPEKSWSVPPLYEVLKSLVCCAWKSLCSTLYPCDLAIAETGGYFHTRELS